MKIAKQNSEMKNRNMISKNNKQLYTHIHIVVYLLSIFKQVYTSTM